MFQSLTMDEPDRVMKVMQLFREDERPEKLDLGVGVYRDAAGQTPIMSAVKQAEKQLWALEKTKSYVGLIGAPDFNQAMVSLILGEEAQIGETLASAATTGGTGAVRAAFELIKLGNPDATVWISDPSWSNHPKMLDYLHIPSQTYRYLSPETGDLDFSAMMEDLARARAGDVVLLHGCCHNPSGINLSLEQWGSVARLMEELGLIPMIDLAYQGFGDGLEEDVLGTRLVADTCPEGLIAASCSKNFGIYRERTGCLIVKTDRSETTALVQGKLALLNRLNYSFPPDHGARLVTMVLKDESLRAAWQTELEDMRTDMVQLREDLADALQRQTNSDRFDFVRYHRGMFSILGLSERQIEAMRTEFGVYAISDSRINIAGLNQATIPVLAKAVAAIL